MMQDVIKRIEELHQEVSDELAIDLFRMRRRTAFQDFAKGVADQCWRQDKEFDLNALRRNCAVVADDWDFPVPEEPGPSGVDYWLTDHALRS